MRHRHDRLVFVAALLLAACGPRAPLPDAGVDAGVPGLDAAADDAGNGDAASDAGSSDAGSGDAGSSDAGSSDAGSSDAGSSDAGSSDAGSSDAGSSDAGSGGPLDYDVRVLADGFCDMLRFDPSSISVPAGTEFTVRWINATGCTDIDIDKSGTVPIVLGLAPGGSYHDTIRRWCGIFTGTFSFRAYYSSTYVFTLPVDCDG